MNDLGLAKICALSAPTNCKSMVSNVFGYVRSGMTKGGVSASAVAWLAWPIAVATATYFLVDAHYEQFKNNREAMIKGNLASALEFQIKFFMSSSGPIGGAFSSLTREIITSDQRRRQTSAALKI